jgi:hypothetical protein
MAVRPVCRLATDWTTAVRFPADLSPPITSGSAFNLPNWSYLLGIKRLVVKAMIPYAKGKNV